MRIVLFCLIIFTAAPAFADCTPGSNLVGPQTRTSWVQGGLVYDLTSDTLKTCDGTNWNPVGGGGGLTCPAGFTLIGKLGCMQTNENGSASLLNANTACHNSYSGRLPTYVEWYTAMNHYTLTNETNNYEWIFDAMFYHTEDGLFSGTVGNGSLTSFAQRTTATTVPYRCFIPN